MTVVITARGQLLGLEGLLGRPLTLRLYTNPHMPMVQDTDEEYREATFPGYAAADTGVWDVRMEADRLTGSHTPVTFRLREQVERPVQIWGWYLTDGRRVVVAQHTSPPIVLRAAGDQVTVDPTFGLRLRDSVDALRS